MNNTEEARDVIVPGIEKAGLDPAQIKYIVMTHRFAFQVGDPAFFA